MSSLALSFFASTALFQEKFEPQTDPNNIIVDFRESRILDHSGIEALKKLTVRYTKLGKKVKIRHVSRDCRRLLEKSGATIEINLMEDPTYSILSDSP